jgi:uncharacterized membrane protein YesL
MNDLIHKENPLLYWFSKIGDFFVLSILWLALCLPLITFIPSCISLYDSVAHCIHGTEDGCVRRFLRTFKRELLRGMLLSILWLGIGFLLFYGYSILYQMGQQNQALAAYSLVYLFTMLIPLGVLAWLIPVESRFEHKLFGLFRSAVVYSIGHLPTTILLLVIFVLAIILVLLIPVLSVLVPAIAVTVQAWFIERVFKKYIPENEEDNDV